MCAFFFFIKMDLQELAFQQHGLMAKFQIFSSVPPQEEKT